MLDMLRTEKMHGLIKIFYDFNRKYILTNPYSALISNFLVINSQSNVSVTLGFWGLQAKENLEAVTDLTTSSSESFSTFVDTWIAFSVTAKLVRVSKRFI